MKNFGTPVGQDGVIEVLRTKLSYFSSLVENHETIRVVSGEVWCHDLGFCNISGALG